MMTGDDILETIGGPDGLRTLIADTARQLRIAIAPGDVDLVEQFPEIIREAQREAAGAFARSVAQREYQHFCRQLGIRPNSQFL